MIKWGLFGAVKPFRSMVPLSQTRSLIISKSSLVRSKRVSTIRHQLAPVNPYSKIYGRRFFLFSDKLGVNTKEDSSTYLFGRKISTSRTLRCLKSLLVTIWPKNKPSFKLRVIFALSLLIASKLLNVEVPFFFKKIIDEMNVDWNDQLGERGNCNLVLLIIAMGQDLESLIWRIKKCEILLQ